MPLIQWIIQNLNMGNPYLETGTLELSIGGTSLAYVKYSIVGSGLLSVSSQSLILLEIPYQTPWLST